MAPLAEQLDSGEVDCLSHIQNRHPVHVARHFQWYFHFQLCISPITVLYLCNRAKTVSCKLFSILPVCMHLRRCGEP
jgi:hypothetical protein